MSQAFDQLVAVMERLRGEGGCPWDREQTPESLKPFLIEEAYEVVEAIEAGKAEALREELGDLLFQVLFHAQIAKEKGEFDIDGVLKTTIEKMTRRHPHVFSPEGAENAALSSQTVLARWEEMKKGEDRNRERKSALDGVPKQLPALLRAEQIQNRAARIGFDWKTAGPVFDKVKEELEELRIEIEKEASSRIEEEFGDLLFSMVNLARFFKIHAEDALRHAIDRFSARFHKMESEAEKRGIALRSLSLEEMDSLWEQAKRVDAGSRMSDTGKDKF